ncbi:MAG: YqaE/Pmp3 family membrane protein [Bacteroidia bacterium]
MKTKKILIANFILAIAVVFASCSSSVEITKRTFNNGYYVHVIKNKPVTEKNETTASNRQNIIHPVVSKEAENKNIVIANQNATIADPTEKKTENTIDNSAVASVNKGSAPSVKKSFAFALAEEENILTSYNNKQVLKKHFYTIGERKNLVRNNFFKGSNTPEIILILLCIFLPFIAVGIVDNWRTRFLIDLLLCLLFYLPGIIYAFIVCFG